MPYPYVTNPYSSNYPYYQQQAQAAQQAFYPPAVIQPQPTQLVPQNVQQAVASPIGTNIIWIENAEKAESYPVAMGNTVILVDYDFKTAFKKSTDLTGKPLPIEVYDLIPRNPMVAQGSEAITNIPQIDVEKLMTKDEFDKFREAIEKKIEEIADSDEEMVVVPVKKRGRKSHVVVETNGEVLSSESASTT